MYWIGHRAASIDSNAISPGNRYPELEVTPAALRLDKAVVAVPAALNGMVGLPRKAHPYTLRHSRSYATLFRLDISIGNRIGDLKIGQLIFPLKIISRHLRHDQMRQGLKRCIIWEDAYLAQRHHSDSTYRKRGRQCYPLK